MEFSESCPSGCKVDAKRLDRGQSSEGIAHVVLAGYPQPHQTCSLGASNGDKVETASIIAPNVDRAPVSTFLQPVGDARELSTGDRYSRRIVGIYDQRLEHPRHKGLECGYIDLKARVIIRMVMLHVCEHRDRWM